MPATVRVDRSPGRERRRPIVARYSFRTRALGSLVVALLVATLVAGAASAANPRVLVFSKTAGYRHASIPNGIQAIRTLGAQNGFDVDATEDDRAFNAANLARYDAVIFLLTTGDVLDNAEQTAFESYIRGGGSYVGVHSASDTERDWAWYGRLVGAWSSGHPEIQEAVLDVATPRDVSTASLPARWTRTDEWYGFLTNPRSAGVRVLISIDESTYQAREWTMGGDHPIAWSHEFDGGRAWYTAGGHTEESYSEPLFLAHLLGGIKYALDKPTTDKPSATPATSPTVRSLGVSVRDGRLAVAVRHSGCTRCQALLRVRAKTTKLKVTGGLATGTSAVLPPGRWQLTVTLTDGETGLTRTVRRSVQVR